MVDHSPDDRPAKPGTITRSVVVDLERLTAQEQRAAAWCVSEQSAGSGARIHVGDLVPYIGAHPDVVGFLADAIDAGVHVRFEGSEESTREWVDILCALTVRQPPPAPRRHLQLVNA